MSAYLLNFLNDVHRVQQSGKATDERSYYGPLNTLFEALGESLRPNVHPIQDVASQGDTGHPDFLLQATNNGDIRAAVEVKGTADDLSAIIASDQVGKYLNEYGVCIVTNLWEFALVEGTKANRHTLMRLALSSDAISFWSERPQAIAAALSNQFEDFLISAATWKAPISRPVDLAATLARYAREALRRLEQQPTDALEGLRKTLGNALGLHFNDSEGEHFFRSSLVQTLFYGLFSAWVTYQRQDTKSESFDWAKASDYLGLPLLAELFDAIARPQQLRRLTVREPLEWAAGALNRTVWENFEWAFRHGEAINYFYEPFLEAFDPELRKQLGVWYTPPEVVKYMVARVDVALREELGIEDGLADPRVVVLDPCCGTGAYPVEVLRFIAQRLQEKGDDALIGAKVKQAATSRVFGFEIMPAPFVISHLQIGMLLAELNSPLSEDQRAGIYLTNALTGWEEMWTTETLPGFPSLQDESQAARRIKRDQRILVVIGNPPYSAFAGTSPEEENGLVELYKTGLGAEWNIKKYNLDDLYIRFFRVAERRITEMTGKGIVCYISNFSYTSDKSFVVMRKRFATEFDRIWIDSLNGNSRRNGKLTPDGKPDPSIFSTSTNREGIKPGTSICLMVRNVDRNDQPVVRFRNLWGVTKRADLLSSLTHPSFDDQYQNAYPSTRNRFSFRPYNVGEDYLSWPLVTDLAGIAPYNGPIERRGQALISIDRDALVHRIKSYFDQSISNEAIEQLYAPLMMTGNRIVGPDARRKILQKFTFNDASIVKYPFKPFDTRWCYLENLRPLFSEPSPQLLGQRQIPNNSFFITRDGADKDNEGTPFLFSSLVCDYDVISGHARHFPVFLINTPTNNSAQSIALQPGLFSNQQANLSAKSRAYLLQLGISEFDTNFEAAAMLWLHALAIGYSPQYLEDHLDGIQEDYPRIPIPGSRETLQASASLGQQIAALLNTEAAVRDVTSGRPHEDIRTVGSITRVGGGQLNPSIDFKVTGRWGIRQSGGVTMPGTGTLVERDYSEEDKVIKRELLGETTFDIYLNDVAYWRNIPKRVWEYTIGGYQVIKKWLSYREYSLLGRSLKMEEIEEVTQMARRIAAILLLEPELDANYMAVKSSSIRWADIGKQQEK
jgi:hypothetical protein